MMGYGEQGLIPRICEGIFDRAEVERATAPDNTYIAEVNYLEIYNEMVRDLLAERKPGNSYGKADMHALKVRNHPKTGPFVDGLSHHKVTCFKDIDDLMEKGNANRTTAATNMNDTSSRSHAVFTMVFTQATLVEGIPCERASKINLVDLAGSERTSSTGATGTRLKEGGNINKSLTTLGLVIHALAERSMAKEGSKKKSTFVPYRDSSLTWLLKESLGGNSKTIMVAAISPADVNYGETLSTLHYANRAKSIVNKAIVNEDENVRLIKDLKEEVARLKELLGGDEEIEKLTAQREKAKAALAEATSDEERAAAQQALGEAEAGLLKAKKDAKTLERSEEMMGALTDQWRQKWQLQTEVMEERGIELNSDRAAVRVETQRPTLVSLNMGDDLSIGITMFYLEFGVTKLGLAGTLDKFGSPPDIELSGGDVEAEQCTINNQDDTVVTLIPSAANCKVNGAVLDSPKELQQGMIIELGRDNMYRFNHPMQASRLKEARISSAESSGVSTPSGGGSAVFSLSQIFEDRRKEEAALLESARQRLEAMEAANAAQSLAQTARLSEIEMREAEAARRADELTAKLAQMEKTLAEKDEAMTNLQGTTAGLQDQASAADALAEAKRQLEAAQVEVGGVCGEAGGVSPELHAVS
jgi:kinesin family protein 16B